MAVRQTGFSLLASNSVQEAQDGRQAVMHAVSQVPDILVTDLDMPELDGLAATGILRWDFGLVDLPIIAMSAGPPPAADLLAEIAVRLENWTSPTLQPVVNAAGVILHTNLGRAPLPAQAVEAMAAVGVTRGCNPPYRTEYCPQRAVTRAEFATMLTRVVVLMSSSSQLVPRQICDRQISPSWI